MNSTQEIINYGNVNDLLFRGKNKAYGAYALRQEYEQRLQRSFFYFLLSTSTLALGIAIYNYLEHRNDVIIDTTSGISIQDTTRLIQIDQIFQPDIVKPLVSSIANSAPIIVDKVPETAPEIKTQAEVLTSTATISNVTQDGKVETPPIALNPNPIGGTGQGVKSEEFHMVADVMPEFVGGEDALMNFLGNRTEFPDEELANGITEANVIVQFVVNEDGSVSNLSLLQKDRSAFNQEALRVVKSMPKWIPGEQNGQKVKVYFQVPFRFRN